MIGARGGLDGDSISNDNRILKHSLVEMLNIAEKLKAESITIPEISHIY